MKLESELLEEPLVLARLVPGNKKQHICSGYMWPKTAASNLDNTSKLVPQLITNNPSPLLTGWTGPPPWTHLSSNLTLASRLALRLRAGSLKTSLLTTVLSRGISTEYLMKQPQQLKVKLSFIKPSFTSFTAVHISTYSSLLMQLNSFTLKVSSVILSYAKLPRINVV